MYHVSYQILSPRSGAVFCLFMDLWIDSQKDAMTKTADLDFGPQFRLRSTKLPNLLPLNRYSSVTSPIFSAFFLAELWASMNGKLNVYGRWQLRARGELSARCFCIGHGNSKESEWPPIPPIPGTVIFIWKAVYPTARQTGNL
jgi:hypothetical protein